jgi:hypothetical protein
MTASSDFATMELADRQAARERVAQGASAVEALLSRDRVAWPQRQLEDEVARETGLPTTVIRRSIWRLISDGVLSFSADEGHILMR